MLQQKLDSDMENGVADKEYERRLTFLYATQTGNAQDLAESLARRAIRQHFTTKCLSVEDYNPVNPRLKQLAYSRPTSPMKIVLFSLLALLGTANIQIRWG